MHEMGLARQLLAAGIAAAGKDATGIAAVRVEIGPLAVVDVDELPECFAAAAQGTIARGATLEIKRLPLEAVCVKCGERVAPDMRAGALGSCPKCAGRLEIPPLPDWRVVSVQMATDRVA